MIPLDEARRIVLGECQPVAPRRVPLARAVGCVLAEPAVARVAVPPFANSAMDGYALRAADVVDAPATLEVIGRVLAGAELGTSVGPGQAARIMTGAPVPDGADAVCMVELTSPVPEASGAAPAGGGLVRIEKPVERGENVRPVGADVPAGEVVLDAGAVVGATQLGALVSAGCDELTVYPRLRVGVISTGDELVEAGAPLGRAQIYDSNRPMLLALVAEADCEAVDLGRAADDEAALARRLEGALGELDAVVLSGGVSVGDVDVVRMVLGRLGRDGGHWMQIAIRPAKPFSFARLATAGRDVPVFGLPGNPVSSAVSFELLVRPALLAMGGHRATERPLRRAMAAEPLRRRPDGKIHFVRVTLEWRPAGAHAAAGAAGGPGPSERAAAADALRSTSGAEWLVRPCPGQGSHQIRSMALADGLAILPDGDGIGAGDPVEVIVTNPEAIAGTAPVAGGAVTPARRA